MTPTARYSRRIWRERPNSAHRFVPLLVSGVRESRIGDSRRDFQPPKGVVHGIGDLLVIGGRCVGKRSVSRKSNPVIQTQMVKSQFVIVRRSGAANGVLYRDPAYTASGNQVLWCLRFCFQEQVREIFVVDAGVQSAVRCVHRELSVGLHVFRRSVREVDCVIA